MTQKYVLLTLAGTRPEALKLAPLIRAIQESSRNLSTLTCFSGQHREILEAVLGDLDVKPDIDLRLPEPSMTLSGSLASLMGKVESAIDQRKPQGIVVQGDTNTALAGALVGFHRQLPVFHVEAGLRTQTPKLPFPEEMNRRLIGRMADLHFAPTEAAARNLFNDGTDPHSVMVTGNTGIDALRIYASKASPQAEAILSKLRPGSRRVLVTMHRRENKAVVSQATGAIKMLMHDFPHLDVMWLLHLNDIRHTVIKELADEPNVHLIEPQAYSTFVHLMKAADVILTDSGGVQEEAPTLGKAVLVLRDETERPEAVAAGNAKIVGCQTATIVASCRALFEDEALMQHMSQPRMPFGDGFASERIVAAIERYFHQRAPS